MNGSIPFLLADTMFIRVQTVNRFVPLWKTTSYINLSNVLRMDIEKNHVNLYSAFRPSYLFYQVHFQTHEEAKIFVEQALPSLDAPKPKSLQIDVASVDPLALQAMADWEEAEVRQEQISSNKKIDGGIL